MREKSSTMSSSLSNTGLRSRYESAGMPVSATESLVWKTVETLEEDIVFGYLHPKERLIEDDLMERFSLKRHVVRQVLLKLEDMGLVERKRNVGALVRFYTIQEVINLYQVRVLLETGCVQQIPLPVPQERLQELIDTQKKHDAAVQASDLRKAFRLNLTFHRSLFALSDNHILTQAIEDYALRAHIVRSASLTFPELLEKARMDHWRILESLREGDRDTLVDITKNHLRPACEAYIRMHRQRIALESSASSELNDMSIEEEVDRLFNV